MLVQLFPGGETQHGHPQCHCHSCFTLQVYHDYFMPTHDGFYFRKRHFKE
jgi:hypothetical protein